MPRCPRCSGLITAGDETCPKCGKSLEEAPPTAALSPLEERLLGLLRQGQKIEAIKVCRAETNVGLKEAKDFVELLATRHGIPQGGGCGKAAAVLLMILVGAVAAAAM